MKPLFYFLKFGIIITITGCEAFVPSRVIEDTGKFQCNQLLYEVAMKVMLNGDVEYIATGDNREAFKPKICGPSILPTSWYVKLSQNGKQFIFIVTDSEDVPDSSYYVYMMSSPILNHNKTEGRIEGSGIAVNKEIRWISTERRFQSIATGSPTKISFVLIPNADYEKIKFPEKIANLLEYIGHGKETK